METAIVPVNQNQHELATTAAAQAAKAEIEASFSMAMYQPRKEMDARTRMLETCKRPRFASAAIYKKPVGQKKINNRWEMQYAEGLSIRAAEELGRLWRNIRHLVRTEFEDDNMRIFSITTIDLEANVAYSSQAIIEKTIERRNVKKGQVVISERQNTEGITVFKVIPTDDELLIKQNALISKAIRNNVLRLIPADIKEDVIDQIKKTLTGHAGENITDQRKKIADAFAELGVRPAELERFLGQSIETTSPAQVTELRTIFQTIKDSEATWADYMQPASGEEQAPSQVGSRTKQVKEKMSAKSKKEATPPPKQHPAPQEDASSQRREILLAAIEEGFEILKGASPTGGETVSIEGDLREASLETTDLGQLEALSTRISVAVDKLQG